MLVWYVDYQKTKTKITKKNKKNSPTPRLPNTLVPSIVTRRKHRYEAKKMHQHAKILLPSGLRVGILVLLIFSYLYSCSGACEV